jgi:hypothetical protein
MRFPRIGLWSRRAVILSWVVWPIGLVAVMGAGFLLWWRLSGLFFSVEIARQPASFAWGDLIALGALFLVVLGPPLAITLTWRASRKRHR